MESLQTSRQEIASFSASLRVQEALSSKLPHPTHYPISPGDSVHVYRENKHTVRKPCLCVGLFSVTSVTGKQETMDYNGEPKNFLISQLLPDASLIRESELDKMSAAFSQYCSTQLAETLATEILTPWDAQITHTNTLAAVKIFLP